MISHVSNLNIVTGDDVSGRVTVRLQKMFLGIKRWQQYYKRKVWGHRNLKNIIRVAPIETIKSEQQSAVGQAGAQEELTELQLLVLPLNYAKP